MKSYRGSIDIIFDIINEVSKLENQKNEKGRKPTKIGKTRIMYLGNMSSTQTNTYLPFCLKKEFLQSKENGDLSVAPNGYDFMNQYKILRGFFNGDTLHLSLSRLDTQTVTLRK